MIKLFITYTNREGTLSTYAEECGDADAAHHRIQLCFREGFFAGNYGDTWRYIPTHRIVDIYMHLPPKGTPDV